MKVICNTEYFKFLTKGKEYEVLEVRKVHGDNVFLITWDNGDIKTIHEDYFYTATTTNNTITTNERADNMKVVCKPNDYKYFTLGKIYDVILEGENSYDLHDDNGRLTHVHKAYFDVVQPEPQATNQEQDLVNNPAHYTQGGIETIDFIQAKLSKEAFKGYLLGSCIKYLSRHEHKGGMQDIKKAQWFINKFVEVYESEGK